MQSCYLVCAWREELERKPWLLRRVRVDLVNEFHGEGDSTGSTDLVGSADMNQSKYDIGKENNVCSQVAQCMQSEL